MYKNKTTVFSAATPPKKKKQTAFFRHLKIHPDHSLHSIQFSPPFPTPPSLPPSSFCTPPQLSVDSGSDDTAGTITLQHQPLQRFSSPELGGGLEEGKRPVPFRPTDPVMIRERSNTKPLHNFALPRLRWANRKQARCMKVVDHSVWPSSTLTSTSAVQRRSSVLPSFLRTRLAALPVEEEEDGEGIEAVREKLMLDLRAETDKIKKELLKGDDEEDEAVMVTGAVADVGKKLTDAAATIRHEDDRGAGTRPWSLRTRRAVWKASLAAVTNDSPARKDSMSVSEDAKGSPEKGKERAKFAVALTKKEIEEDFFKLTGNRPPRRPKKRRYNVQKKLDVVFPGQWLTEVTADAYEVVEVPGNGKR